MSQTTRQELLEHYRRRYSGAGRRGKTKILDEFCGLAGYDRKHAIKLLNRKSGVRKKPPGRRRTEAAPRQAKCFLLLAFAGRTLLALRGRVTNRL